MADAGPDGFARAVRAALDRLGTGLLGRPQEFAGAVADLHDPDSPEMAVLYVHCTDELLRPYADAARERAADALGQAAGRGELWLHDVRRVDAGDARSVAWGIARGVAAHLGVALPGGPGGGASGEAAERVRAVLSDDAATEADVAAALAAVRALPEGAQRSALEAALGRRLASLAGEREAEEARRAAEERSRREAEEARRAEAARRRREERDRLLAEREARRRAAADARSSADATLDARGKSREDSEKPRRVIAILILVAILVACFGFVYFGTPVIVTASPSSVRLKEGESDVIEFTLNGGKPFKKYGLMATTHDSVYKFKWIDHEGEIQKLSVTGVGDGSEELEVIAVDESEMGNPEGFEPLASTDVDITVIGPPSISASEGSLTLYKGKSHDITITLGGDLPFDWSVWSSGSAGYETSWSHDWKEHSTTLNITGIKKGTWTLTIWIEDDHALGEDKKVIATTEVKVKVI